MKKDIIIFIIGILLFIIMIVSMTACSQNSVEPFEVDSLYCDNYPEYCKMNDSTGVNEIYCGQNHDGVWCDCEVDFVGHPYAVRECNVWSL